MKKIFSSAAVILLLAAAIFADIAVEPAKPKSETKKSKTIESRLTIQLDKNADQATLVISKKQANRLRAELEQIGDDGETIAAVSGGGFSRLQTIAGGAFLSLAMFCGGLILARSRRSNAKNTKTIAGGAVLLLVGTTAGFVFANVGPPPALRSISGELFNKKTFGYWSYASGDIKIEVQEDSEYELKLIVPDKEEKTNKTESRSQ